MTEMHRLHIQGHGRVSIPSDIRKALGLTVGTEVFVRAEDRRVVITAVDDALAQFQRDVADRVPADRDLVAELIADRRAEAARDD
jgi:AbrB family looped-hinge helix DNA binding protein